ncbi:preprotein translocase subunit SecG [Cypionkella sp.]|uniref:preprotein translocase subunit SecG n=1 Tax=Cypionkella sp. TaxID=2811411 RepID=UPI002718949C|nr:preprotein translocase subunit SecG [Cypionkella sp.]MDO8984805.1 preprotein translocase subunit SecG [Cypionkella sp.]MDP1577984.1 preprotein translocase subunit SecG [Cypionkella sp.]MDP2050889.1 preprotein translocase subunit SecG [Cypionkella sp.]
MENVVLTVHLILALLLIGVVLLQRSEGGGLGMGSSGGAISGRAAATALGKVTWVLAAIFIVTSITMTILASRSASTASVIDQIGAEQPAAKTPAPALPAGGDLLPPSNDGSPAAPPAATAPTTPPAAPDATAPAAPASN